MQRNNRRARRGPIRATVAVKFKGAESPAEPLISEPPRNGSCENRGNADETLVGRGVLSIHGRVSVLVAGVPFARYQ